MHKIQSWLDEAAYERWLSRYLCWKVFGQGRVGACVGKGSSYSGNILRV